MLQHRSRILGTEADHVHNGWVQLVAGDRRRIIWITHENKAFFQPVRKPVRVEGRYVCSHSCLDDHAYSPGSFHAAVDERSTTLSQIREAPDHGVDSGNVIIIWRYHGSDVGRLHFAFRFQRSSHLRYHARGERRSLGPVNVWF